MLTALISLLVFLLLILSLTRFFNRAESHFATEKRQKEELLEVLREIRDKLG